LADLAIALSKLLLVKLITIQRRLQSKEQFWPPVSFQAFGNGFFASYNPLLVSIPHSWLWAAQVVAAVI
jgi:hypothetical protein